MVSCQIVKKESLNEPKFIKPYRLTFKRGGKVRDWEVVESHDSVAILLYHKDKDAFILVKQFRPAVFLKNRDGYTVELCAGLVDKQKSLKQIAKEEILEECGYDVPLSCIEKITSFYTAVGFAGGKQTLYYCKVNDNFMVNSGGGIDDEEIEVIYLPLKDAKSFLFDETIAKTPGLLFSFMWFSDKIKLF